MKNLWAEYKKELGLLIRNNYMILAVFITIALCYGFALTNPSISIDDTASARYLNGESVAQGRFLMTIINRLMGGVLGFAPFWSEFIALLLMTLAGLLYCCLFKKVTKNKMNPLCNLLFMSIFLSFPLINVIFIYNTAIISIGIGYLFAAISAICAYEFINNKRRAWSLIIGSVLLMAASISGYESSIAVFLMGVAMILFLDYLYNIKDIGFEKRRWLWLVLVFVGVALSAVVLEYTTTTVYMVTHNIAKSSGGATGIYWSNGIVNNFLPFIKSLYCYFIVPTGKTLSVNIFQVSVVVFMIFSIIMAFIKRNYWLLVFSLLLVASNFSLSLVQGAASPYRTCQTLAIFVAFVVIVLYDNTPKKIRGLMLAGILYLFVIQSYDLSQWFYNDNLRNQEERNTIVNVANVITSKFDTTKPVAFIGRYELSPNVKIGDINGYSVIDWGMIAYGDNTELFNYFQMNGFYFVRPTARQLEIARANINNLQRWPKSGSVIEYDGIIVVRF